MRRASRVCAEVEPRLRGAQRRLGILERLLRAGRGLEQRLRALEGLLALVTRGLGHVDVGLLQVGVDREQRRALLDRVALAHRQRLDAAGLVGADEDQIGLDPALVARVVGLRAAGERQQRGKPRTAMRRAFMARSPGRTAGRNARASSRARRAARSGRTARSRSMATMPGAASSCGNRTSASVLQLAALDGARAACARIAAITREITSR